jgi:N-methylhydantoinase B/oxoprolinase/acetone carboxylase alpha subunit
MNRHNIYLNNINNVLVHNGKEHPIVRKWEHPWLLLDDCEAAIAYCHLTKDKLRQLYRRFGHPAAERLYKMLSRAGYDDINKAVISQINKCYH